MISQRTAKKIKEEFGYDFLSMNWKEISKYKGLSETFIKKYIDKVDLFLISKYQNLAIFKYPIIPISKTPIIQLSLCNIPRDYRYNSIRIIRLSKYSVL